MNIKNIIYTALMAMAMSACSNIAEDERLIYVEPATVNRNVLIEDFTGQRCVKCPNATVSIEQIQEAYGSDHVIAVAIHSGRFGFAGNAKYVGLMNDECKDYWSHWFEDSQGQPVAKINRGSATEDFSNWSSIVAEEMKKETTVQITLVNEIDMNSRNLHVTTIVNDPKQQDGKLQLWLVEDGIVALQLQPDGSSKMDYEHNHVFRASINSAWGEALDFNDGYSDHVSNYTIPEGYVIDNCSIVAFVYNDKGVEQVTKKKIEGK